MFESNNILNAYKYGSHVYGTNHAASDDDFIAITKEPMVSKDVNIHFYTLTQFSLLLQNHDIAALECLFLDSSKIMKKEVSFKFTLDKQKLRTSISTISSNSWVKGKKKLIVTGDYDKYLAIKSIFHSLRILDFGIQIATHESIVNYGSMNYVFEDLMKMSEQDESVTLWNAIDTKYRKLFNSKSSEFKALCPKDASEKDMKANLKKVIAKYDVKDASGLLDEILMTIKL